MSPDHPAIRVSHPGKRYTIGGPQEKYLTFRDAIVSSVKAPFRRFSSQSPQPEFRVLKDVSFDVEQGEVVGIIGRNGAGKPALLKILSQITSPSEGTVDLYGRVGSLLEVGTGFHPEQLTIRTKSSRQACSSSCRIILAWISGRPVKGAGFRAPSRRRLQVLLHASCPGDS